MRLSQQAMLSKSRILGLIGLLFIIRDRNADDRFQGLSADVWLFWVRSKAIRQSRAAISPCAFARSVSITAAWASATNLFSAIDRAILASTLLLLLGWSKALICSGTKQLMRLIQFRRGFQSEPFQGEVCEWRNWVGMLCSKIEPTASFLWHGLGLWN